MLEDDEILKEFLLESLEHLDIVDESLLSIESGQDADVDGLFRCFHSIKSAASFLELADVETVSHHTENVLSIIRDQKKALEVRDVEILFQVGDFIRKSLEAFEGGSTYTASNQEELLANLKEIHDKLTNGPVPQVIERPVRKVVVEEEVQTISPSNTQIEDENKKQETVKASPIQREQPVSHSTSHENQSSINVNISLIDEIINLIGELVVSRNQAIRVIEETDSQDIRPIINRIDHLTTIIQEKIMTTRMRVIDSAWKRYPRMVRDVSKELGKKITLKVTGQETELDRSLLNMLQEPMRHLLRNCIDHGIEQPEERVKKGKPEEGTISLKAYQSTGQVVIEISDDGKGLDEERILSKALSIQLLTEEEASHMSTEDIQKLIFAPGFSTKQSVTQISGRGVGMDIVHTQLLKVGGQIDLHSELDVGTKFIIRVPLTLAILPSLIVNSNNHYFAIPQDNIVEIVDLKDKTGEIKQLGDTKVYSLRGDLLPLLYFQNVLSGSNKEIENGIVIILCTNDLKFGVVFNDVLDTEEVVVKPLGEELKGMKFFSGVTIQGNGSIAWIVDPNSLAESQGLSKTKEILQEEIQLEQSPPVLRFYIKGLGSAALLIQEIVRIEEIHDQDLRLHSGNCFFTLQKQVVPVFTFGQFSEDAPQPCNLILCDTTSGMVALRVSEIFDICHENYEVSQMPTSAFPMILVDDTPSALIDPNLLRENCL